MREHSGLLTDLYELTMAAGYFETHFDACATFELFVRDLPPRRNYLVAAGLEHALEYLEKIRFTADEISYLRAQPAFRRVSSKFFDYLSHFQFSGEVLAMPEGTLVFANEPLLRVTAPIIEAQLVETSLLAILNFQTMVASKAARVVQAAAGRDVIEFGARRAHGREAGLLAARAATIGGCAGTSNTLAGELFGIPVYGTQAHSWIMAHEDESGAFQRFLDVFPDHATLLLDTYDVRNALKKILALDCKPAGVRLDSGNLAADSRWVRRQLDRAGWTDVKIFASGDLNEDRITGLIRSDAKLDAFGVGAALVAPSDTPNLNLIYKLVEVERGGRVREAAKFSHSKVTYPGRKQVFRFSGHDGKYRNDMIGLEGESFDGGEALLQEVMRGGKRTRPPESLGEARTRCAASLARLPERFHRLRTSVTYPVHHSKCLQHLFKRVRRRIESARSRHSH